MFYQLPTRHGLNWRNRRRMKHAIVANSIVFAAAFFVVVRGSLPAWRGFSIALMVADVLIIASAAAALRWRL